MGGKRAFSAAGMIASVLVVIFGLLVISGVMGGDTGYPGGASSYYSSGYASFGADFYTYVNNNAAEAAEAARTTAYNVGYIAELLKNAFGLLLISIGLLSACAFGVVFWGCEKPAAVSNDAAAAAADAAEEASAVDVAAADTTEEALVAEVDASAESADQPVLAIESEEAQEQKTAIE